MADGKKRTDGAGPTHVHIEKGKPVNWLAWIALALGLLALLLALSRCDRDEEVTTETVSSTTAAPSVDSAGTAVAATATASVGTLGAYLAGTEVAPQTFEFDTMNFATASSELTPPDKTTVENVAGVLTKYPTTNVKIVGYADARGSDADNQKLGLERANAVKAALSAKGVDAARIATGSGGEADPVDTNATADGQTKNRRTELVVVSR